LQYWDWQYIKTAKEDKTHPDHKLAKSFRDTAKNTYYGWLNGAGADRIQEQIAANTGQKPSLSDCQAAIEGCVALYPKVVEFRKALMKELKQSSVTVFGQPISVNAISDGSRICLPLEPNRYYPDKLEPAYTQNLACIWSRIEATAMKNAFIQVGALARQHPEWELKVINVVHDELDLEVNGRYATEAITAANNIVGDCFKAQLKYVDDGRSTDWKKLLVKSWADK
jgi:DNA polymerase I-like protein with 3'-5' exonuclease and polymerase domains